MSGASVGYAARPSDVILDKVNHLRSVKRAFLDHLAFDADPIYAGATVLSVRSGWLRPVDMAPPAVTIQAG